MSVKDVDGTQKWCVYANSKEEALKKFENGEGAIEDQEIEVMSLSEFDIDEIEEVKK